MADLSPSCNDCRHMKLDGKPWAVIRLCGLTENPCYAERYAGPCGEGAARFESKCHHESGA